MLGRIIELDQLDVGSRVFLETLLDDLGPSRLHAFKFGYAVFPTAVVPANAGQFVGKAELSEAILQVLAGETVNLGPLASVAGDGTDGYGTGWLWSSLRDGFGFLFLFRHGAFDRW